MKIKIQQFLFGKSHSWAIVGQNIGRALLNLGHDVDFISTDGFVDKFCPQDLRPFVKDFPRSAYDCQISYTAPHNWGPYLANGNKNKFGIWNYEYNSKTFQNLNSANNLLHGFAKHYKYTSKVLPSSNFSKTVFLNMGVPENHLIVVPHGINLEDFNNKNKLVLKTKKTKKILLNIAQPHKRKALPLALESFGKAFSNKDDVCLVAKVFTANKGNTVFDVDFLNLLKTFKNKYKNHAEILTITDFVPNISELYNACDVNFSATHAECWHLPSLEAHAAGLVNVVPNYGGQLDFCSDKNSLLISGKETRAPRDHQYWHYNQFGVHFEIDTDDAAGKLKLAVNETENLLNKFSNDIKGTVNKFTWENAARSIVDLCE